MLHARPGSRDVQRPGDGEYDDVPEQAFVAVGGIDDVLAKAEKLKG